MQCQPFQDSLLADLLRQRAQVAWVVGPDTLLPYWTLWGPGYHNGPALTTPGQRSIISCYPINKLGSGLDISPVMMAAELVGEYFHSPTSLASPSHAFLLPARSLFKETFNSSSGWVAALTAGQDPVVDRLLTAAAACPLPLLFSSPLDVKLLPRALGSGMLHHVVWGDQLCVKDAKPRTEPNVCHHQQLKSSTRSLTDICIPRGAGSGLDPVNQSTGQSHKFR